MGLFRFFYLFFLMLTLTGCLSFPKNDNKGGATVFVKISGIVSSQLQISLVEYGTYYLFPQNMKIDKNTIDISNLQMNKIKKNIKSGTYNNWVLLRKRKNNGKQYIVDEIEKNVTLKDNCLTIMPFKVFYQLGTIVEGSSYYVNFKVSLQKLSENEIADIIKDLRSNKNVLTYNEIYFGDVNITEKIKR